MLCSTCNRALGWYENNQQKVTEYLQSTEDFQKVLEKIDKKIQ